MGYTQVQRDVWSHIPIYEILFNLFTKFRTTRGRSGGRGNEERGRARKLFVNEEWATKQLEQPVPTNVRWKEQIHAHLAGDFANTARVLSAVPPRLYLDYKKEALFMGKSGLCVCMLRGGYATNSRPRDPLENLAPKYNI